MINKKIEKLKDMGFNEKQIDEIIKADVLEWNGDKIIGWGSDEAYGRYCTEVENGQGYYDNNGHFNRNEYNPED